MSQPLPLALPESVAKSVGVGEVEAVLRGQRGVLVVVLPLPLPLPLALTLALIAAVAVDT